MPKALEPKKSGKQNHGVTRILLFGTFDMIHAGHENLFKQAARQAKPGTVPQLIASVARDVNVERIKKKRPQNSEKVRLKQLKVHPMIYEAVLGAVENYLDAIVKICPDVIVLGYDQVAYVDGLRAKLREHGLANVGVQNLKINS
jgi:cytidyltransferase-like protein